MGQITIEITTHCGWPVAAPFERTRPAGGVDPGSADRSRRARSSPIGQYRSCAEYLLGAHKASSAPSAPKVAHPTEASLVEGANGESDRVGGRGAGDRQGLEGRSRTESLTGAEGLSGRGLSAEQACNTHTITEDRCGHDGLPGCDATGTTAGTADSPGRFGWSDRCRPTGGNRCSG